MSTLHQFYAKGLKRSQYPACSRTQLCSTKEGWKIVESNPKKERSIYMFRDTFTNLIEDEISKRPQNDISFYRITESKPKTLNLNLSRTKVPKALMPFQNIARKTIKKKLGCFKLLDELYTDFGEKYAANLNQQQQQQQFNFEQWQNQKMQYKGKKDLPSTMKKIEIDNDDLNQMLGQLKHRNYKKTCIKISECAKFYETETKAIETWLKSTSTKIQHEIDSLTQKSERLREEAEILKSKDSESKKKFLKIIEQLEVLEEEIAYYRKSETQYLRSETTAYLTILQLGYDVRSTGIIWLIKKLRENNVVVQDKDLPRFLDDKSSKYLLDMAALQSELFKAENKRKELIKLYRKVNDSNRGRTEGRLPSLSDDKDQLFAKLEPLQLKQEIVDSQRRRIIDQFQEMKASGGFSEQDTSNWNELVDNVSACRKTSSSLIYAEMKSRLTNMINSKLLKKDSFNKPKPHDMLVKEYNQIEARLKTLDKELRDKRDKERKRVMTEIVPKEKDLTRVIAIIGALFGFQSAERAIRTNETLKKMVRDFRVVQ